MASRTPYIGFAEYLFANRLAAPVKSIWPSALPFICFSVPSLLVTNYTLNHFYVNGGYFFDSGYFAFLATHASGWPMQNLPAVGGTYFSSHFSPMLYLLSAVHSVFLFWMPSPVFFSVVHGMLFGCLSFAVWRLIGAESRPLVAVWALALSLIAAFNGVALASIGFPHIEIGIPAMLLLAMASYLRNEKVLFFAFLVFGLSLREDAGLHYFGVFFLLFLWTGLPEKLRGKSRLQFAYLAVAIGCLAYSALAIFIQSASVQGEADRLREVYVGSPLYAHVTWTFIREKLWENSFVLYVFAPLALTIVLSLLRRDILSFIGFLSTIPWLVLSFFAHSALASQLTSYYSFPVIIGILWPAVAYRIRAERTSYLIDFFLVTTVSTLLFITGAKWNHDNAPWKNFGFSWKGKIDTNQRTAEDLFRNHKPTSHFVVDDALASLVPELVTKEHWRYGLAWDDDIQHIEMLIFKPGTWQDSDWRRILTRASLNRICKLDKSNFFIATRTTQDFASCTPIETSPR